MALDLKQDLAFDWKLDFTLNMMLDILIDFFMKYLVTRPTNLLLDLNFHRFHGNKKTAESPVLSRILSR